MANVNMPEFEEKRELLYSDDVPVERVKEVGRQFMEAGLYSDALEFFERSRSAEDTRKVAGISLEAGDVALWLRCKRILGEEPDEQSLRAIAANAEAQRKYMFAVEAWRRLEDDEQIERLRAALAAETAESAT